VAPEPVPPVRQYSFTDWQVNNPTAPPPGDRLDAEFDRANQSIAETIAWTGTSLNTDGTLRTGIVDEQQLVPGLFDHIADDAVAQVQPLVDQAGSYATQALNSATAAQSYAGLAGGSATQAGQAATDARTAATTAQGAATGAQGSASAAAASASSASTSANHADGVEAVCEDYGLVTQAWAEHMPDTIPPNILAVMGVTGEHWSSRWWANQADLTINQGLDDLIAQGKLILAEMEKLFLGGHPSPPTQDSQGNPLTVGSIYYDETLGTMFVWTGDAWKPVADPLPTVTYKYIFVALAGQTLFQGADRGGVILKFNPGAGQDMAVFENGVLRTPTDDYVTQIDQMAMLQPCQAGDIVQIWVQTVPVITYNWTTVMLDTSGWVFDGVQTFFPLVDRAGDTALVQGAVDLILSRDGVWQQSGVDYTTSGTGLHFTTAPHPEATVFGAAIVVTPPKQLSTTGTTALDTSGWVFNGTNTMFPLLDLAGAAVTPGKAENLLISLGGVWQAAYRDYTVSGSAIQFVTAPGADTQAFAVSGLPSFSGAGATT
jgi:hypothetical protein